MRIEREDRSPVGSVWAVLSREEAWDLLDSLVAYFCGDNFVAAHNFIADHLDEETDPAWHHHLGAPDELTLMVEHPDSN